MELLLLLSTLLLLTLTLILFLSLKLLHHSKPKKCSNLLPPGNTGWPFLGETLEFISAGRDGTPEKFFTERTERYSSEIFKTSLIGEEMAVLCGAAGNKFLFSNENKLVTSWFPRNMKKIFPSSMEASTEDEITKVRKFLPAGNLKLAEYVGVMDAIAKQHMDAYWDSEGAEITVLPLAKHFMFSAACRLFLSIDDPGRIAAFEEPFRVLLVGVFSLPVDFPGTNFNRSIRASELIRKEVLKIIKQRKREREREKVGHGDILDHMLATTDEEGRFMAEPDIADKIIGLIVGGQDTTSTVITFIMKYLAEFPHIYENVFKEQREIAEGKVGGGMLNWEDLQKMKYSWSVACEAMRLAPPVPGSFREAIADFTYQGFSVPKGWKLYWSVNTTHRNPECFEEPEKFDPSRFEGKGPIPYSFVPFGGGPRMCPGQEYARLVILVLMHNLVTNFRWEKVLPDEKIVVEFMPKPANGLPLRMRRHSSSPS